MSEPVLTTLIKTMPGLLWVVFAATVFFVLRRPIKEQLARLRSAAMPFGTFTFEVALDLVERAGESQDGRAGGDVPSRAERRAVATRLEHAALFLDGGRILWVDDEPADNASLVDLFRQARLTVRTVRSTDAALAELNDGQFDLVITDMARPGAPQAGFDLADLMPARGKKPLIILYTLRFDPSRGVHPGLFAYTTAYDDLIHLVIDAMERIRFGAPDGRSPLPLPLARRGR
ncbi:response regulator [Micromonospora sp. A3M-1-15]|uniref:response regulator n=1 Tax=Micromonospora TaxID=1873 RepID=UPI0020B893B0|nr:response regulator [Micromonospora sp. A3M-1-15]MCP3787037.1 response regulator [Micromonospora sp. A3M-1-15]